MKKLFQYVQEGTPAYVILHAQYRRSRGRRPVATLGEERNPIKALRAAEKALKKDRLHTFKTARDSTAEILITVATRLGLRFPTVEEAMALLKLAPKERLPVPYIQWNERGWSEWTPDRWDPRNSLRFLTSVK